MNCPVCIHIELSRHERLGIDVNQCPQCGGVWLDRRAQQALQERTGLFLKQERKAALAKNGAVGLRRPLWQLLFAAEKTSCRE